MNRVLKNMLLMFTLSVSLAMAQEPPSQPAQTGTVAIPPGADMIKLKTGSILFGRLKSIVRGIAVFDIVGIGDTNIKLIEVVELQAHSSDFQVDIEGVQRTTGKIGAGSKRDSFVMSSLEDGKEFALTDIVLLKRVELKFLEKLDGFVGLGYSYSSGTDINQFSLNEVMSYTTMDYKLFNYLTVLASEGDGSGFDINRLDTGLGGMIGLQGKWLGLQYFQYQDIPAMGLDSRLLSITGGGMRIVHNPLMDLNLLTGLTFNREQWLNGLQSGTQREIPVVLDFKLGYPRKKLELKALAAYYYSLSVEGRQRFDFQMNMDVEVYRNFTVGMQYLYNHDNQPLDDIAEQDSTTTMLNFGYKF
jgi:hypothetical protein